MKNSTVQCECVYKKLYTAAFKVSSHSVAPFCQPNLEVALIHPLEKNIFEVT